MNESILMVEAIFRRKPKVFIEIGTASGFSTAMFAKAMALVGGEKLLSFDVSATWYVDQSKPVGFLARDLGLNAVPISFIQGTSAKVSAHVELGTVGGAFVDGSHYHPWPTIDTLILMPFMEIGGFIGHHDLNLYMHHDYYDQYGPKYLFDQTPDSLRTKDREQPFARSFIIDVPEDYRILNKNMSEALCLPWSVEPGEGFSGSWLTEFVERFWDFELGQKIRDSMFRIAQSNKRHEELESDRRRQVEAEATRHEELESDLRRQVEAKAKRHEELESDLRRQLEAEAKRHEELESDLRRRIELLSDEVRQGVHERARIKQEIQRMLKEQEAIASEREAATSDREAAETRAEILARQLLARIADINRLNGEVRRLALSFKEAVEQESHLSAELASVRARNNELARLAKQMRHSLSWRITRPVRLLRHRFPRSARLAHASLRKIAQSLR
jgi:hypothetical protein